MLTTNQIRAARAYLNLGQSDIAEAVGVSVANISDIENERTDAKAGTLKAIQAYYEQAGLEFTDDGGVRPRTALLQTYQGKLGFAQFLDEMYDIAKKHGGDYCLWNARPSNWVKWTSKEKYAAHAARMAALGERLKVRITTMEGEKNLISSSFAEYRWIPKGLFNDQSFYAYGDKLAFLNFGKDDVTVVVLNSADFARGFRVLFNTAWEGVARTIEGEGGNNAQ